jgi:Ca2+-transporting ATPase
MERTMPRRAEIPFSSERGMMTTLHDGPRGVVAYVKGAPERVLERSVRARAERELVPLDRSAVLAAADKMAAEGLRVLAFATRELGGLPGDLSPEAIECDLTFLGLVGLLDPPRGEACDAVSACRAAGIQVVMITGDHPATAAAIARQLGIGVEESPPAVTGRALARMSSETLAETVQTARVYARVAPEQKIAIVKALQERGEFVAMTGDGVNDAPALRRADIGIAMAKSGTDVAREAAHMVLLDDNFASIVAAVREGRRIYDNIRKFVRYSLSSNSGEIWVLFLAPFLGLPVPLLPIHILWINLVTDGLPGLALAVEPAEAGVMRRPPLPPTESILGRGLWQHAVWVGLLMGAVSLFTEGWAYHHGSAHWRSMTFTVLTLSQLGHLLAIRSERESIFRLGFLSNPPLLGAVLLTLLLQLAALYVPAFRSVLKTEPLTAGELGLCLALSAVVFLAVEIEKRLARRRAIGCVG